MSVLIIKNIFREGPGLLKKVLDDQGIDYQVIEPESTELFNPEDYSTLIVFGGPSSANDQALKIQQELSLISKALRQQIPYLGVCLGMQLLVKAAGGQVEKAKVKEIGWKNPRGQFFTVKLTPQGQKDPLFAGLSASLKIFQLHGETVALTDKMKLLGSGEDCENQVIKVGANAYGIQGHFELTPAMFEQWLKEDPELSGLNQESLKKNYQQIAEEYEANGEKILTNFFKIAGLG